MGDPIIENKPGDQTTKGIQFFPKESHVLLNEQSPLSIEEIAKIRSEKFKIGHFNAREYLIDGKKISVLFKRIGLEDFKDESEKEEVLSLLKSKREGEAFIYEHVIVNSLLNQLKIAKSFNLFEKEMFLSFKLDFLPNAGQLMDGEGFLNVRVLSRHIRFLKEGGANEDDVITEISGHMFHESVHDDALETILNGKSSLGELTPVTAQLAYYLLENYKGPKSYDCSRSLKGAKKIKMGTNSARDYDVVTYVAGELLLSSLKDTYPEFKEIEGQDNITACEKIVSSLSLQEKEKLTPCFKRAIESSASEEEFNRITAKLSNNVDG